MRKTFLFVFLLLCCRIAFAVESASVLNYQPSVDGGPYLTLSGSQTLKPYRFHLGLQNEYARQPLLRGDDVVMNSLLVGHLFGAVGILPWWEIGVGLPVSFQTDTAALDNLPTTGTITREKVFGLGDVRLESKFRLLNLADYDFGIAAIPFVSFPTGDGNHFLGNGSFAGGGKLVLEGTFEEKVFLTFQIGYLMRKNFIFPGTAPATERDDAYLVGTGLGIRPLKWLEVIAEANSSFLVKAPLDRESETPLEVNGGLRFHIPQVEDLQVVVGGGSGFTFGYGSPSWRGFLGVEYTRPNEWKRTPPPPEPEPVAAEPEPEAVLTKEKIEIQKKIHFEYGRARLREVSYPILEAVAKILQENLQVKKIRIEGHTDDKGTELFNLRLSQQRADSVRKFLIEKGVEPGRLSSKGYGESQPIDSNETDLGRARNRRVEFVIEEQETIFQPESGPQMPK